MAFFLTPRLAPAYQQASCNPFGCAPRQRVSRSSFPPYTLFLNQVDELLRELNREAQREAHRQRLQRKRAFRARFDVRESGDVYQVEGELPGFEHEHIDIQVTDEYTLKIIADTQRKSEPALAAPIATESSTTETKNNVDDVALHQIATAAPERPASPASENGSHKSYNATVEDDFEDLGAETSTTLSADTATSEPKEFKGKEKAVEPTETAIRAQQQTEVPIPQETEGREWLNERVHGSFERTFQFPERIDANNVRATLKNGILFITVPKAAVPVVKKVNIQ